MGGDRTLEGRGRDLLSSSSPTAGAIPGPRSRLTRALRRTLSPLFALLSVCVSLLAVEGALRAIGYEYTPLRIEVLNKSDYRLLHAFDQKDFVYDPVLLWRPRPGRRMFDALGYRGPELSPVKQPGEFRIVALGDSNTLGWGRARDVSWPRFLRDILAGIDPRFRVVNAGVWGYTSFQGVRRFREALAFHPDLALVSFGANDAHRVVLSDAEFARSGVRRLRLDRFLHRTRVGQLVTAAIDAASRSTDELVPRVSLEEYRANLEEMVRIGGAEHTRVVLLTRPFTGVSPSALWWKTFAPAYNAATLEVAERDAVPSIDVYEFFRARPDYFNDESHFTEEGHRAMARLVYERIEPLLR